MFDLLDPSRGLGLPLVEELGADMPRTKFETIGLRDRFPVSKCLSTFSLGPTAGIFKMAAPPDPLYNSNNPGLCNWDGSC